MFNCLLFQILKKKKKNSFINIKANLLDKQLGAKEVLQLESCNNNFSSKSFNFMLDRTAKNSMLGFY